MKPVLFATVGLAYALAVCLTGCSDTSSATDSSSECGPAWKAVAQKDLEALDAEHKHSGLLHDAIVSIVDTGDTLTATDLVNQAADVEGTMTDTLNQATALIDAMPPECR